MLSISGYDRIKKGSLVKSIIIFILGVVVATVVSSSISFSDEKTPQESLRKSAPKFIETKLTDKKTSVLAINYGKHLEDEILNIEVPTKIYDVGMTAYTKEFADRYGYSYDYVEDLSPGMQAIGFEMKTDNASNSCILNVVLDEDLNIDYPENEYVSPYRFAKLKMPAKREELKDKKAYDGYKIKEEYADFFRNGFSKRNKYSTNTSIATSDYEFKKKGARWNGIALYIHTRNQYPNSRFFSFNVGCMATMHNLFLNPDLELRLKKKGAPDFRKYTPTSADDFVRFKIPEKIRKFAQEIMHENDYIGPWFFMNKYYED
jgi:hypothetical protein